MFRIRRTLIARLRPQRGEAGFTLLEVVIALSILSFAAAASLGFILAGLKGSLIAKADTVGRNLTQETLERLHNLPFHISADVSSSQDLLDLYYTNASGSGVGRGVTGYVPSSATRFTADGDPATGAFYRTVSSVNGFSGYTQYVDLQFITTDGSVSDPLSGFDTSVVGNDRPAAYQVAAYVTTFWKQSGIQRKYTAYSQIAAGRPIAPKISLQLQMTALQVTGPLANGDGQLSLNLADLDLNGSLTNTSTATATMTGAWAELAGANRAYGATTTVAAPPTQTAGSTQTVTSKTLSDSGNVVAQFAQSEVSGVNAGSTNAQPYVGSSTSQVFARLDSNGSGQNSAVFSNQPSNTHLGLTSDSSIVQAPNAACNGCAEAYAQGYAASTSSTTTHSATSAGSMYTGGGGSTLSAAIANAQAAPITLFPTAANGNGLVQIALATASVSCSTGGSFGASSTGTVNVSYQAYLRYIQYNALSNSYTWSSWLSLNGGAADPLASVNLGAQVGTDSAGLPVYMSDYIASWSSLTSSGTTIGTSIGTDQKPTRGSYSLLSINTQPLRSGDSASAVGVKLGAMSCVAEDYR